MTGAGYRKLVIQALAELDDAIAESYDGYEEHCDGSREAMYALGKIRDVRERLDPDYVRPTRGRSEDPWGQGGPQ